MRVDVSVSSDYTVLMTHDFYCYNIMRVYRDATPAERTEGMDWYPNANAIASRIANGDVWKGAGVLAAFSPMLQWERNLELAIDSLTNGYGIPRNDCLGNSWRAAMRIIHGEHALDVLNGDKTRAFCAAIADPFNSTVATIDRHAYNIANGSMEGDPKIGKRVFRAMSDAYVECAEYESIGVCQMQSVTWTVFRNRKGLKT